MIAVEIIYFVVTKYKLFYFLTRDSAIAFASRVGIRPEAISSEEVYPNSSIAVDEYNHIVRMDEAYGEGK
jgi:hypothetical protein